MRRYGFGAPDGRRTPVGGRVFVARGLQRRHETDPERGGRRCPADTGEGIPIEDGRAHAGAGKPGRIIATRWKNSAETRSADSRSWMRWAPFVKRQSLNEPR